MTFSPSIFLLLPFVPQILFIPGDADRRSQMLMHQLPGSQTNARSRASGSSIFLFCSGRPTATSKTTVTLVLSFCSNCEFLQTRHIFRPSSIFLSFFHARAHDCIRGAEGNEEGEENEEIVGAKELFWDPGMKQGGKKCELGRKIQRYMFHAVVLFTGLGIPIPAA